MTGIQDAHRHEAQPASPRTGQAMPRSGDARPVRPDGVETAAEANRREGRGSTGRTGLRGMTPAMAFALAC